MKLERIQIDNFLGAHHIDVRLTTAVTLFAGWNGACKSSIGEAVRMAMGRDLVRVKLKKDYDQLVTDDSKAGGALITLDDDRHYSFNVPKGDFEATDGLPSGPNVDIALNGQRFASMTHDERRTYLFGLTKVKRSSEEIQKLMLARGCDADKVEMTLPMLRSGFPSASEFAAKEATASKGSWRAVTGETYGPVKGDSWKAVPPAPPQEGNVPTAATLAAFDEDIAELNKSIGEITTETRNRTSNAAKRKALEEKACSVDRIREALEYAQKELAEVEPKVIELRQRAAGTARVGVVHELAFALQEIINLPQDIANPAYIEAGRALDAYENEYGEIAPVGKIDVDAKNALPEHERGLEIMQNAVKNYTRDLAAAIEAKGQFDALAPAEKQEELADVGVLQASLAKMKLDRAAVQEKITAVANYDQAVAAVNKKTEDAFKHHSDVAAWSVVANALAPDGIPGDLLKEALEPVNDCLQEQFEILGWKTPDGRDIHPYIWPDMRITIKSGRPYHLMSESERWRIDAMIAAMSAIMSGIKILMLDRVDVLDIPARGDLLQWVNTLVTDGDLDTVLLFATLKQPAGKLIPSMTSHWVENGSVAELKVAA